MTAEQDRALRRRAGWRGAAAVLGTAFVVVAALVPLPYLELGPGPTYNVIGEVDGKPLIEIAGRTTYPTEGNLNMTTVSERGGPDNGVLAVRVLAGWLAPETKVLPREAFYPDDVGGGEVAEQNARLFSDSEATAVAAALRYLDIPVLEPTIVSSVIVGSPSDGKLEPGDIIVSVNGSLVTKPVDVKTAMAKVTPGDTVKVVVRRGEPATTVQTSVVTTTNPQDPSRAFLGIEVGTTYKAPFKVEINLDRVGGPSAGLFFALGIVDKLTPGPLNGGKFVAGTGTINPDGKVGAIGGIGQKLRGARNAGATLFLAPADNCAEAVASGVPSGLTLAKVSTLSDAVNAIEAYVAGKPVPSCTAS